jgi:hypothetical protein
MEVKAPTPRVGGTGDCRATLDRAVQRAKDSAPIDVTQAGKLTEVRDIQPAKTRGAMAVTG